MKLILSVWFVYGTFYLDSPIHTELYLTNDCESAYEQIIQKKDFQIKTNNDRNYVGYVCNVAGDSEGWLEYD